MIKLFLCDVDGILTDGIYHTTERGDISKSFFTRDFHGLWMLNKAGVKVGIITAASDDVIDHQCRRGAKYVDIIKGTHDKKISIRAKYVSKYVSGGPKFEWDEIAFIGDDVFDEALLRQVGLAACSSDADSAILQLIRERDDGFVTSFPGGKGCVREFAEYVLDVNKAGRG